MSKQAQNFEMLVKGNNINSIITAIQMLKPSVRKELLDKYNVSNANELAFKLK